MTGRMYEDYSSFIDKVACSFRTSLKLRDTIEFKQGMFVVNVL